MWNLSQTPLRLLRGPTSSLTMQIWRQFLKNDSGSSSRNVGGGRSRSYRIRPKGKAGTGSKSVEGINPTEAAELSVPRVERNAWSMWKPTLFTIGFGGCCYAGATIWEYEHKRSQAEMLFNPKRWSFEDNRNKFGEIRREINAWWQNRTRGEKVFMSIAALNGLVYIAWQIPAFRRPMIRYFTASYYGEKLLSPMVLSTFSHYSFFHLAINMYVLWSFSGSLIDNIMGAEQYVGFYLTAGVVASLVGYAHRAMFRMPTYALGASGAILGILTYTCCRLPNAELSIIFLPFITFSAQTAVVGIVALDVVGLVLRWRLFDHAAHLGGSLFGIWYAYYGEKLIWQRRLQIIRKWKQLTGR